MHVFTLVGTICGSVLAVAGVVALVVKVFRPLVRWGREILHSLSSIDTRFAELVRNQREDRRILRMHDRRLRRLEETRAQ